METVDFIDNMDNILKRQNVVLSKPSSVGTAGKNCILIWPTIHQSTLLALVK